MASLEIDSKAEVLAYLCELFNENVDIIRDADLIADPGFILLRLCSGKEFIVRIQSNE